MVEVSSPVLKDAKAPVVGVANEHSIAYGCAKAFREVGAEICADLPQRSGGAPPGR